MRHFEDMSSEELVEATLASAPGDHRAFSELVGRHRGQIVANCLHLTRAESESEDLAQEVLLKAYFKLKTFEGRALFMTWVQRIKINHCLNYLRARKSAAFVDGDVPADLADMSSMDVRGDTDVESHFKRRAIRAILSSMPDTLRVPLILCDMDGLSYQEGADQLGIGLSAFKMRVKRAREWFRSRYDQYQSANDGKG